MERSLIVALFGQRLGGKLRDAVNKASLGAAMARIAAHGIPVATVIDIGASDGRWSRTAERHWPHARFHLVEASDHWRPALDALVARKPRYSRTIAAAGPAIGQVAFKIGDDPFGGAIDFSGPPTVPMVTVDSEVERLGLKPPYLLKLDTHGPEREILSGAKETLKNTSLLINEFYNFETEERRWPQMVMLIESMGFRCIDLIEPLWRPDGTLWQMDFAFVASDLAISAVPSPEEAQNATRPAIPA
jgi:FkbM family methyltransferase